MAVWLQDVVGISCRTSTYGRHGNMLRRYAAKVQKQTNRQHRQTNDQEVPQINDLPFHPTINRPRHQLNGECQHVESVIG